jgi:hypothetical protein
VTLYVAPRVITDGEPALAYGHLSCTSANGEASQAVTLYQSSVISPSYSVAGTTTTDTHGFYQVSTSDLTANSVFYVIAAGAQSAHRTVRVAAQVTLAGPPEGVVPTDLRTGRHNTVDFTGTVSPADVGALVVLQRQNAIRGDEWHRIDLGSVNGEGKFSISHTFVNPGDASIRVVVHSGKRNIASPSNVLDYEISQAQNPQLTIESSADPISYGQSVAISGVVAGAPNTMVKLLAHSAQQGAPTTVGEVTTNASGDYTFPAQTPLVSTFYRVEGAGKSSAVLYEGVKYVLTTVLPQTAVQAGQSLTFSGTVTPGQAGHVIYLERENPGPGFHVIEVGTLNAAGTGGASGFALTHTFYNAGTYLLRLKIPGGPLNGTTDSQLFTIQVAPASSPDALTPETPGNSTLPPEGEL